VTYDGGKNGEGVWHSIICQMPPHRVYIEAFAGSLAVLRRKRPAQINLAIEKDELQIAKLRLEQLNGELPDCDIMQGDALERIPKFLRHYRCSADTLIYADPPYLRSTRTYQRDLYRCEFASDAEHAALLELLDRLPCMVMLSGYQSRLYQQRLSGYKWRAIQYPAPTRQGWRLEWLWMNFPEPSALHDYRFIGAGRTDRQRIRRKVARWKSRLQKMTALERGAIFAALQDVQSQSATRTKG
jgi:hypothetical protein